ncbi:MAG: hypothetical protein C4339_01550 [Nitrososphaerota archaeon]
MARAAPYTPRTYFVYPPGPRGPLHCTILPKLSERQLSALLVLLESRGLRCERLGPDVARVRKEGLWFRLERSGIMTGSVDPLEALPELFALLGRLAKRWRPRPEAKGPFSSWRNAYLRLLLSGPRGRIVLSPRLEAPGAGWSKNRERHACLLLPDELLVLAFAIRAAKPRGVELLSHRPFARARPLSLAGRLYFLIRLSAGQARRWLERQALHYPEEARPQLLLGPDLSLLLFSPRPFALTGRGLRGLWYLLGRWCLDPQALAGELS